MTAKPSDHPMTLTEKILLQHAVGWPRAWVEAGETLSISVDWTLASEIAWSGMNRTYEALGRPPLHNKDRFYLALDHTVDKGTLANDPRTQKLVQLSRSFSKEAKLEYFFDANTTIMHTEFYRHLARPGEVVLGADSHTSSHGGLGAFAVGLGGADVVAAMIQGRTWIQVPEAIRVHYAGRLAFGLSGKDVVLKTLGQLGRNTVAMERSVEYTGDEMATFSTDARFTIANMTAELGGLNGVFAPDQRVKQTMARRLRSEFREGGWWFQADEGAHYVDSSRIDLSRLIPQVAKPYSPDNVCDVVDLVDQELDGCFIGACTTSEEELILAALVMEQALREGAVPVASENRLVVPGSVEIVENLRQAGLLEIYQQAGFRVGEPGCSMCIGIASDRAQPGERWLSSQNRNFHNRMGKGSIAWLSSAVTVAASSFDLRIRDPRALTDALDRERVARFLPDRPPLAEVIYLRPKSSAGAAPAVSAAASGRGESLVVRGRAQVFGDHVDTDAMIAAEFCHLSGLQELGEKAFLYFRPDFRRRVEAGENILVAGEGWGTGSSREQAVWALKGAGVRAVVARSYAFIHKRNLVNEAVPFVVVRDEAFYRAVADGAVVEVDVAAAKVRAAGKTFEAEPMADAMAEIAGDGGLVSHVSKSMAASAPSHRAESA